MPKPVWISHRGLTDEHEENTLEAFKSAVISGFSVLETDLRITSDGHIALFHDHRLSRLAGDHRCIEDCTRRQLENIQMDRGGKVLFLDQFIAEFSQYHWVFDVKLETGERVIKELQTFCDKGLVSDLTERAKFLFWSASHQRQAQRLFPGLRCYARRSQCWRAALAVLGRMPSLGNIHPGVTYSLVPSFLGCNLFCKELVSKYQQFGATVLAFLPRDAQETLQAVSAGIDEILVDGYPQLP